MTIAQVRQLLGQAEDIDPPVAERDQPAFTEQELEEILTYRWQIVLRRVMADSSDEWLKGFVRSIARHGKRATWKPTEKQAQIMRQLVSELGTVPEHEVDLIER